MKTHSPPGAKSSLQRLEDLARKIVAVPKAEVEGLSRASKKRRPKGK